MTRRLVLILGPVAASLLVAACGSERDGPPSEEKDGETRSIFRPEFQVEPTEAAAQRGTLETRLLFPEGAELTEEARADLATVLASPQAGEGGTITLRGHSDSSGSDAANMRASQERAEAVRDWLIANGVEEERIVIIAFGEQNPAEPNALPDGTPNEKGRAANRRVEIEVRGKDPAAPGKQPTLAESLAEGSRKEEKESAAPPR